MEYRRFIAVLNPWELKNQLVRPDLFTMLTDTSKGGFLYIEKASALYGSFERMTELFQSGRNIYEEMSAALGVLSAFYEIYRPRVPKAAAHSAKRLTDKVRVYIEQNFGENIRIAEIAAENFVSEGYLSHAFKEETGLPLLSVQKLSRCDLLHPKRHQASRSEREQNKPHACRDIEIKRYGKRAFHKPDPA